MSTEPEAEPVSTPETETKALPGVLSEIRWWVRDIFFAVGTAILIVIFLYQPVKVEGTSMLPELRDQERIFVNKFVYRIESISRKDIVVFWYPRDPSKSYIKRIIGMPGDTVEILDGAVYVNEQLLTEPYVDSRFIDHRSFPAVFVEPGHYYVLGDHRNQSNDSRMWDWSLRNTSTAKPFSVIGQSTRSGRWIERGNRNAGDPAARRRACFSRQGTRLPGRGRGRSCL